MSVFAHESSILSLLLSFSVHVIRRIVPAVATHVRARRRAGNKNSLAHHFILREDDRHETALIRSGPV